jgi:mono/diheme cytochrome c family protein
MSGKVIISVGVLFAGGVLFWVFGADAQVKKKNPGRLINSIEGRALYTTYCAVCHGSDARGHGPMASALKVPPADLTRIAERNGGIFPMTRVERVIAGEEPLLSGHGTREMPLWGPIFSQVDDDKDLGRVRIDNLTRYLMAMQTKLAASAR